MKNKYHYITAGRNPKRFNKGIKKEERQATLLGFLGCVLFMGILFISGAAFANTDVIELTPNEIKLQERYDIRSKQLKAAQEQFKVARCELGAEKLLNNRKVSGETIKLCKLDEAVDVHATVSFITGYEDFVSDAYEDLNGEGLVIGYGFKARGRTHMSKPEADSIIKQEVVRLDTQLDCFERGFSAKQKVALISLQYNLGGRNLCSMPTLKAHLEDGTGRDYYIKHFSTINGVFSKGVNRRRIEEANLFYN